MVEGLWGGLHDIIFHPCYTTMQQKQAQFSLKLTKAQKNSVWLMDM